MKAAVCNEFGKPLSIEEVRLEPLGPGEVRVRIAATAICHSDIHAIRGDWGSISVPVIAGHESAGIVAEVGEGVTLAKPGDRVILSLLWSCGRCFYCISGSPELCEYPYPYEGVGKFRSPEGKVINTACRLGSFAEEVIADQSQVVIIEDDIPMESACLLACGVVTGLGAVVNTARVRPGSTVAVIGAGGVGLNAVQGAALAGAAWIVALDTQDRKLEVARQFGATHAFNAREEGVTAKVIELAGGRGADYVFVTVGSKAAVAQGLELTRRGGMLVVVGMPAEGEILPLPLRPLAGSGKQIIASFMGATKLRFDVPRLVDLYRQRKLKLDELITARYPLERINEAIESVERGEAIRNVILFDSA